MCGLKIKSNSKEYSTSRLGVQHSAKQLLCTPPKKVMYEDKEKIGRRGENERAHESRTAINRKLRYSELDSYSIFNKPAVKLEKTMGTTIKVQ